MREDKAVCFWFDQFYGGLTNYAMRVVTEIIVDSEASSEGNAVVGRVLMAKNYWKLCLINIAN
jgi:hypothetical protein